MRKEAAEKMIKDGMNDRYQGKYPEALDEFDFVIKKLSASDDEWAKLIIGDAMHQLGVTLQNMGKDYKAALSCLWCTIAYRQSIGDQLGLAYTYFQIPMCRLASGEKVEDVMPAFEIANKAMVIAISLAARIDDFKTLGDMWHNTAYICQLQGNYSDAITSYGKALRHRATVKDKRGVGLTKLRLAECYLTTGDEDNRNFAKLNIEKALKFFQELGDISRIKQAEKMLKEIEQIEQKKD